MSENTLIVIIIVFVGLIILGVIKKYRKKLKKEKEDFCVLYADKIYILTAECSEKQCVGLLGTPDEAYREKDTTILCYFDHSTDRRIKFFFKQNKLQQFEYEEVKRDYGGW